MTGVRVESLVESRFVTSGLFLVTKRTKNFDAPRYAGECARQSRSPLLLLLPVDFCFPLLYHKPKETMMRRLLLTSAVMALLAAHASAQTADEIIAKYIKTVGGMDKIQ